MQVSEKLRLATRDGGRNGDKTSKLHMVVYRRHASNEVSHEHQAGLRDIPSYPRHRASGQAVVTLNGVDHYLGPWNTPQSRAEYDRVTSEWLARGRRLADRPDDMLVKELIRGYYSHLVATLPKIEVRHT